MQTLKLVDQENKFLKNFFLLIFFYIVLEGAIRKWLFPNLLTEIIFIRDSIIIYGILYSFKNGIYKRIGWQKDIIFFWTLIIVFWIVLQLLINQIDSRVYLIGFRNWVLYFWFSLMFVNALNKDILDIISKIILLTIIPMGLLVVVQHYLPANHVLNAQSGLIDVEERIFTVAYGIVRTVGTFTFAYGYSQYMAFVTPFFLYFIDGGHKNDLSKKIKFILILSYVFGVMVSGSRGVIINASFMFVIYLFYIVKNRKEKKIIPILLWILMLTILALVFFQDAIEATMFRFESAGTDGWFFGRIYETITGSEMAWKNFSFLGTGIGAGSNMSREYIGGISFFLGEGETDRILGEGGLIGLLFFIFKILFSIIVLFKSYSLSKASNNILPFFFAIFISLQATTGSITGQINAHAFTFLGLALMFSILTMNFNLKK